MAQRIDDAMIEVIAKLSHVTEHLREYGFEDSANRIAKSTHDIVGAFTNVVIKFSDDELVMDNCNRKIAVKTEAVSNENGHQGMAMEAHRANGEKSSLPSQVLGSPASSWAEVAAAPEYGATVQITKMRGLDDSILGQPSRAVSSETVQLETVIDQEAGSLVVSGNFRRGSLNFLTSKIHEGPLYSVDIAYSKGYAKITFQKASDALTFVSLDRDELAKCGHGIFGPGFTVISTETFDWDDGLHRMVSPPRERRRLTFARAGFLGSQLSFKRFQTDIIAVAGIDAIDLIWAFNAGNITTVFQSVTIARNVRNHFLKKAAEPGAYKGVQITFSTDPCEKPLCLVSQMPSCNIAAVCHHRSTQTYKRKSIRRS